MTRDETILEALAAWQPRGDNPHLHAIPLDSDGAALSLTAERNDELACQLREVAVTTGRQRTCTPAELTERAVNTANRITGLIEPLKVYEVDALSGQALLRSANPTERGGQVHYFELILNGLHSAGLKRYKSGGQKQPRESMPFVLTHETIAKLAGDLIAD